MSSDRQFKREQLKTQYKKFTRAWGNEKAYQKYVVETLGKELPEGSPRLGRKPTFNEWKKHTDLQAKLLLKQKAERSKTDDIPSLDWDEDEPAPRAEEAAAVAEQAEVQGK